MPGQYSMVLSDGVYSFAENDYGRAVGFKLYDPTDTAFNASTYTGYVKIFDDKGVEVVTEISPSWTTQASGIGTFAFTSTNKPTLGQYHMEMQLEKAGNILSFSGYNPITVFRSPTGARTP